MDGVSDAATLRNCSICGAQFPDRDLIQYNDVQICPACKPAFFARLKADQTGQSRCSVCGASVAESDLIQYDGAKICAACKPAFFQKLKEGADMPLEVTYAGFWRRAGAIFVDGIIFQIFNLILYAAAGLSLFAIHRTSEETTLVLLLMVVQYAVYFVYETFFIGKFGATPGKMALGVKVINADGSQVGYLKAFGRLWAYFLSGIILGIGYIMAGFDDEKRALHDRICNTRVIMTKK